MEEEEMRISMGRKGGNFALSLFLVLFCLGVKALAAEDHKASVSRGTLYMVQADGSVFGYGRGNIYLRSTRPLDDEVFRVPGLENIVGIDVGKNHALALDSDGCIWAWGSNEYDQLGFQEEKIIQAPKRFDGLCGVVDFDSSHYASIVLFEDKKTVQIWGADIKDAHQGRKYQLDEPIKKVVSYSISFAIAESGNVYAWGNPGSMKGLLGKKDKISWEPKKLDIPCHVKQIDIGVDVIFVCESGDVYMFGSNTAGTLGNGNTKPVDRITKHPTLSGIEKIMGAGIRIAKTYNNEYFGWGDQLLGPVEWTNSGYITDPEFIKVHDGVVDFYSENYSIFFIKNNGNVLRLVPEEHWLFPVKYSLEDYSFQEYQYKDSYKE
ncbi:hypothetical protein GCM10009113_01720 [Marinobacter szutsaonensis]